MDLEEQRDSQARPGDTEPAETASAPESAAALESAPEPAPEHPDWPTCPWCSASVPPDAETCPSCHATLQSHVDENAPGIPGVTEVAAGLLAYKPTPRKPQRIVDTLIRLLDENQEQILAGLYPEKETKPGRARLRRGKTKASEPLEAETAEASESAANEPPRGDA